MDEFLGNIFLPQKLEGAWKRLKNLVSEFIKLC